MTSCEACLAWGMTYCRGVCLACYNFAGRTSELGACSACGRRQLLKRGYCRLCWQQAALERPTGPGYPLAPYVRRVRHQQLFLADLNRRRAQPRTFPRRYGAKGRPHKPPPPPAGPVEWAQLTLFEALRAYRYGRLDLRRVPAPDNPWLAWALHLAHARAEARGFDPIVRRALNRNLLMLLADYRGSEPIRTSAFYEVLRDRCCSIAHTSDVLEQMGILVDDRSSTFEVWLAEKLDGLAPAIRAEIDRWVRTLRDGGPRSLPRDEATVRTYLRAIRPILLDWSSQHQHLREITRDHVLAAIGELRGHQRQTTLGALRSLFAWAARHRVVFRNPANRIKLPRLDDPVWQPLSSEEIARTVEAATTPQARVFVVLAAVHAARSGAIRALTLDDVDLGNRRLTIAGRERPLDGLTCSVLRDWLEHRRHRWPSTANPHLLISARTAVGLGPVSAAWVNPILRGHPATLERLRIDRQLEEAVAGGGDPLHLAAVFEVGETTAIRYAANARRLAQETHAARPAASPRMQASSAEDDPSEHLGSR
ncbi:MAG: tyrosine-type recombinase/integrase [Thermoleophilaceae bacterium]